MDLKYFFYLNLLKIIVYCVSKFHNRFSKKFLLSYELLSKSNLLRAYVSKYIINYVDINNRMIEPIYKITCKVTYSSEIKILNFILS
jgi:hypothetical protein